MKSLCSSSSKKRLTFVFNPEAISLKDLTEGKVIFLSTWERKLLVKPVRLANFSRVIFWRRLKSLNRGPKFISILSSLLQQKNQISQIIRKYPALGFGQKAGKNIFYFISNLKRKVK